MASHRKDINGSGPVNLVPRAKVASATAPTSATTHLTGGVSADYMEALKLLNEETMSRACDLLLSDRDYKYLDGAESEKSNTSSTDKSDLQQLNDLYQQVDEACTIIAKEAVNLPSISMPLLHGHHHHHQPVQRPGMVPSARASVTTKAPAPKSMIPNRRMATMARVPPVKTKSGFVGMMGAVGTGKRAERQKSMPDMSQQVAEFANKRPRTGSIVKQPTASKITDESMSNTTTTNPPPAAMQFLAKLNQDNAAAAAAAAATAQTSKGTNSPGKQRQATNDKPPSSSSSSSSSQDSPSPKPPTRSQPSRASRNRS